MDKLAEIRNQELICRERALSDTDRGAFWLAKAEEWARRALDEIAFISGRSMGTASLTPNLKQGLPLRHAALLRINRTVCDRPKPPRTEGPESVRGDSGPRIAGHAGLRRLNTGPYSHAGRPRSVAP